MEKSMKKSFCMLMIAVVLVSCFGGSVQANIIAVTGNIYSLPLDGNLTESPFGGNLATMVNWNSPPKFVDSLNDKALEFSGSGYLEARGNDIYTGIDKLNFGKGSFSISLWFKTDSTITLNTILDKRDASGQGYHICLYYGIPVFQMGDESGGYNYWPGYNTTNYNDGQWHHMAVSVNRTSTTGIKMYIDNNLIFTGNPFLKPGNITSTSKLYIGRHRDSTQESSPYNFRGCIDELNILNRAVSSDEVFKLCLKSSIAVGVSFDDFRLKDSNVMSNYIDGSDKYIYVYCLNGPEPLLIPGKSSSAARFGGSTGITMVEYPSQIHGIGNKNFSMAFTFRTSSTKAINTLVDKRSNDTENGYQVCLNNGVPVLQVNGVNYWNNTLKTRFNDGQWHFLVINVEKNSTTGLKMYVDNSLIYTGNPTNMGFIGDSSLNLSVGGHKLEPSNSYLGDLDEMFISHRLLTSTEISRLSNMIMNQ